MASCFYVFLHLCPQNHILIFIISWLIFMLLRVPQLPPSNLILWSYKVHTFILPWVSYPSPFILNLMNMFISCLMLLHVSQYSSFHNHLQMCIYLTPLYFFMFLNMHSSTIIFKYILMYLIPSYFLKFLEIHSSKFSNIYMYLVILLLVILISSSFLLFISPCSIINKGGSKVMLTMLFNFEFLSIKNSVLHFA